MFGGRNHADDADLDCIDSPNLIREAERTARKEGRTQSELAREALRVYIEERRWRKLLRDTAARAEVPGLRNEYGVARLVDAGRK